MSECDNGPDCPHCKQRHEELKSAIKERMDKMPEAVFFVSVKFNEPLVDVSCMLGGDTRDLSQALAEIMQEKDHPLSKIIEDALIYGELLKKKTKKEPLFDFNKKGEA